MAAASSWIGEGRAGTNFIAWELGALCKNALAGAALPSWATSKGFQSSSGIRVHESYESLQPLPPHCKVLDQERLQHRGPARRPEQSVSINLVEEFQEHSSTSTAGNKRLKGVTKAKHRESTTREKSNSTGLTLVAKNSHPKREELGKESDHTLIGGLGGNIRQDGKIVLPQFTVSEARETKVVCRALQEDDQWTPRVEQALWALSPKLHTHILARILKRQTNPSLAWKVFQWAESLPGFEQDSCTFYALIEVLGKAEDLQAIWALINDMRIADIKVKPIPFTFLISSYGRVGKIKEAEMTLHSMREFNCKPNIYTYNAILFALFKARKTIRALFTFQKMLAYGCQPDNVTFNTLIKGLCVDNHTEAAAFYLDEMLKVGLSPDMRTFNIVIANYLKSGQLQNALNVYELALKSRCKPNTITHSMLLNFLFKMGMFKDALNLFKDMINNSCDLDVVAFTTFLHGLFKCNKLEMAFAFFESLVNRGCANVATFNVVLDWFCKKKQMDKAVEVVQDMRKRGIIPNTSSYNSLIMGSFKDGRTGLGLAFASQMIEEGCTPDLITYTVLMDFFLKKEEVDDAVTLFKEITANGFQPDIIVYNRLLLGLFRAGRITLALSFTKEMFRRGCQPNKMTYRVLKSWLHKQGQSAEALKFIAELTSFGCDASFLLQKFYSDKLPPLV